MVAKLAKERLAKNGLTASEEEILKTLVKLGYASASTLSMKLNKTRQYTSKILVELYNNQLLNVRREGKNRIYSPILDAVIAYASDT